MANMEKENIYTSLEKHRESIYDILGPTRDRKAGHMDDFCKTWKPKAKSNPYCSMNDMKPTMKTSIGVPAEAPETPVHVNNKGCRFKLLLSLICILVLVALVGFAVYYFTYMKKVVQEKSCGQNYTLFLEENKDLQREVTQLKERVTAVDEACPVRSTSVQGQTCSVCPYGWMLFNSSCYFFSTDYLKWNESQNHCTSVGGYLVIIEDEEEQNILTALVDIKGAMDKSYWIGLTDQKIEGQYVWVNNKTLKSNQGFWGKKEHDSGKDPDNWTDNGKLPAGEDCVHIQKTQRYSGWYDIHCERPLKRICEGAAATFPAHV
ncbi:C-type lectin domain family 4 member D-like [Polypterus senegalus]|uniref:C-type lectin domain family 4 member D-like n=1 Tax=Polypterus senegalus TaxID=55291 RepID=UPI0019660F17|nr:C-type lectin domain family 4 member D-like [Polypterus senegalus]